MAPRKAKRAKTTSKPASTKTGTRVTRKSARDVGGLKDMLEMPLDILHEVRRQWFRAMVNLMGMMPPLDLHVLSPPRPAQSLPRVQGVP